MKKLYTLILLSIFLTVSVSAQCTFETAEFDNFEYNTLIDGIVASSVYHTVPKDYKPAHSPTRYCYMNFVNNLASNSLVLNRSYDVCVGLEYKFSAWFSEINGGTSSYTLQVVDANDSILMGSAQTNNLNSWAQWSSPSFTATTTTIKFQLIYKSGTGNNDLAMDDLKLERCQIDPFVGDSISVCISSSVNLIDSLSLPLGLNGSWTGPSALTNDSLGTFIAANMLPGEYAYSITSHSACPDSIGLISVDVDSVEVGISLSGFSLMAAASNASYQWINCDNMMAINGETAQTFNPTNNGSYAVIVTQEGCSDTSACELVQGIGQAEFSLDELNYYPNPSEGILFIDLGSTHDDIKLIVYNKLGQRIEDFNFRNEKELTIDLSHYASGIYYLNIDADGVRKMIKIFVQEHK